MTPYQALSSVWYHPTLKVKALGLFVPYIDLALNAKRYGEEHSAHDLPAPAFLGPVPQKVVTWENFKASFNAFIDALMDGTFAQTMSGAEPGAPSPYAINLISQAYLVPAIDVAAAMNQDVIQAYQGQQPTGFERLIGWHGSVPMIYKRSQWVLASKGSKKGAPGKTIPEGPDTMPDEGGGSGAALAGFGLAGLLAFLLWKKKGA